MDPTDDDKDFEKFLMASISGSENTSALNTGREKTGKSLDWNLSSSEDMDLKQSRFLKSGTQELKIIEKDEKSEPESTESKLAEESDTKVKIYEEFLIFDKLFLSRFLMSFLEE